MKQHKKILSIFLAALLLLQPMTLPANASVSENNTQAPPEEPSISANDGSQETNLPGNDLDADVAKAGQPASVKTGTKKILFFSVHILSNPY